MKFFLIFNLAFSPLLFSVLFVPSTDEDYADKLIEIIESDQNQKDPLKYCEKASILKFRPTLRSYDGSYCKNPLFGGYAYYVCFSDKERRTKISFDGSECHKNIKNLATRNGIEKENIKNIQDSFYAALNNISKAKLEKICMYFKKSVSQISTTCPPPTEFIPSFQLIGKPVDKLPVMLGGEAMLLSESTSCDLGKMDISCQCCLTKHYHFYGESSASTFTGCAKYCTDSSIKALKSRLGFSDIKNIFEKTSLVDYGTVKINNMSREGSLDVGSNFEGVRDLLRSTKAFLNFEPSSVGLIKKLGGGGSYAREVYLIPFQSKKYILKFTKDPAAIFEGGFPGREIKNLAIVRDNTQLKPYFDEQAAVNSLRLLGMKSVLAYQDSNKKLHYGILMEAAQGKSILSEMNDFVENYGTFDWQKSALKVAAMLYSFGNRLATFHLQLADQNSPGPIKETIQHRDLHGENAFVYYNTERAQKISGQINASDDITKWASTFRNFSKDFSFSLIDLDTMALSIPGANAKWLPGSSVFLSHKLNRKVIPEGDLIKPVMYHLCALVAEHRLWDKKAPMSALMKFMLAPFIVGYLAAYPSTERRAVAEKMRDIMLGSFISLNTNAVASNPVKLSEVQKDYIRPFFEASNLNSILASIDR